MGLRGPKPQDLRTRFEASFVKSESGCWLWRHYCKPYGYGHITIEGVSVRAHRQSWLLYRGAVPDGQCVLHKCDVRNCVNPDHLFLGTRPENTQDMVLKGRQARGKRNGQAKLSVEQVAEIRASRGFKGAKEVAAKFGIHWRHVYQIRSGGRWVESFRGGA